MTKSQQQKKARDFASLYIEDVITALVDIVNDPDASASARVAAAKEILDRAEGRPRQSVEVTDKSNENNKYNSIVNQLRLDLDDSERGK